MRPTARRFTLVELLVAIGIGLVLIAAVAAITQQVQRSISDSTRREDAVRYARVVLGDIERDVANLVGAAQAPDPFTGNVLEIEAVEPRGSGNPARDRLRLFTVVRVPGGGAAAGALGRGFVEYSLEDLRPDPGGGPPRGTLHRRILEYTGPGDTAPVAASVDSLVADDVISFQVEWLDASGTYRQPSGATADGSAFSQLGKLDIVQDPGGLGTRAKAASAAPGQAAAILTQTPIGGELLLIRPGLGTAPVRVLVRRRLGAEVLLNERLPDMSGVEVRRFAGPVLLRVTLTLVVGRGGDAQTARFSKTIAVLG
ncbi:MAG: hypothetical protein D6731_23940 [Planctomycetota bacterium]|nr:MAG: hypothetical protein D6731_23940 [Planctomycetota bacterium]